MGRSSKTWLDAAHWIASAVRYTGTESHASQAIEDNCDGEEVSPHIQPVDVWSHYSPAACAACAARASGSPRPGAGRRGTIPPSDDRPRRPK
eukprot:15207663-Heterocapsa_arctica.AAC.1